jgi:hypothetical protein
MDLLWDTVHGMQQLSVLISSLILMRQIKIDRLVEMHVNGVVMQKVQDLELVVNLP